MLWFEFKPDLDLKIKTAIFTKVALHDVTLKRQYDKESAINGLRQPNWRHWLWNWKSTRNMDLKASSLEFNWLLGPASLSWNVSYFSCLVCARKKKRRKEKKNIIMIKELKNMSRKENDMPTKKKRTTLQAFIITFFFFKKNKENYSINQYWRFIFQNKIKNYLIIKNWKIVFKNYNQKTVASKVCALFHFFKKIKYWIFILILFLIL